MTLALFVLPDLTQFRATVSSVPRRFETVKHGERTYHVRSVVWSMTEWGHNGMVTMIPTVLLANGEHAVERHDWSLTREQWIKEGEP